MPKHPYCEYCGNKAEDGQYARVDITWHNGMRARCLLICLECLDDITHRADAVRDEREPTER